MKSENRKRIKPQRDIWDREIVFMPALSPLEAAMIPAQEKKRGCGALAHARRAFEWDMERTAQRQKIWVR